MRHPDLFPPPKLELRLHGAEGDKLRWGNRFRNRRISWIFSEEGVDVMALNAQVKASMDGGGKGVDPKTGRPSPIEYHPEIYDIAELLAKCTDHNASDLHLAVGRPPVLRINGVLHDVDGPSLVPAETHRLVYGILNDLQKQKFEDKKELDFSLSITNMGRFRVNVHLQRGSVAAAVRRIDSVIKSFEDLKLPSRVMEYLSRRPNGFVLITGPTGSGKSTTLASMIDLINRERDCHVITVEDPIEYLHYHKRALIEQREINEDTYSFASALKYSLRQDPDVLMIGEMRDLETISAALTAAETGHLVFSTLHTVSAVQTVDRMIDVFPPHQQDQVRIQLSSVVEGVLCQKLLPSQRKGREIAVEVMLATDAIRNLIREGHTHMIQGTIESGGKWGMITMDRSILDLYRASRIARETALLSCNKPDEMRRQMDLPN
jgi:twitching motility protein PilT